MCPGCCLCVTQHYRGFSCTTAYAIGTPINIAMLLTQYVTDSICHTPVQYQDSIHLRPPCHRHHGQLPSLRSISAHEPVTTSICARRNRPQREVDLNHRHHLPVLIHLSVFDIAILMDIPELASEAMQKMHHILSQRAKHVPIEHFEKLVSRAWKEQDNDTEMDVHGQIHVLRRRIATYGVVMQYAFEEENLKLHRQLINPDGKYSKYGRWHSKADALVKTRSNYTFPPFIQTLMNKSKAEKAAKAAREAEDAARAARNSRNAENTQNAEDAENAESTDSEN